MKAQITIPSQDGSFNPPLAGTITAFAYQDAGHIKQLAVFTDPTSSTPTAVFQGKDGPMTAGESIYSVSFSDAHSIVVYCSYISQNEYTDFDVTARQSGNVWKITAYDTVSSGISAVMTITPK